eukprot:scaffold81382_cov35-Prasinocladus_malaysianus.AAC.2
MGPGVPTNAIGFLLRASFQYGVIMTDGASKVYEGRDWLPSSSFKSWSICFVRGFDSHEQARKLLTMLSGETLSTCRSYLAYSSHRQRKSLAPEWRR